MRLGLNIDGAFRRPERSGGEVMSGTELLGFMRFAAAVGSHFDRFAVIARGTDDAAEASHPLPPGVELIPLPYYPSLRKLGSVAAAMPRTVAAMWRSLDDLDAVWVSGVNPFALVMALLALARRRRVVLLIRQDSPRYFASRLPSRAWAPLLAPLRALNWCFRALGRRLPVTVVGPGVAGDYGAPRPNLLEMRVSLLSAAQLSDGPKALPSGQLRLLTVGRIDTEKNPLAAVEALAILEREQPGRFRLIWVGEGPLAAAAEAHAAELGVDDRVELPGYVPYGDALLERYRNADVFVHVSLTEGVPGVLYEAMGSGLPVVATDVGGVAAALDDGAAGVLVPPSDPAALAAAISSLVADPARADALARRGLELARERTIEAESASVARFIEGGA